MSNNAVGGALRGGALGPLPRDPKDGGRALVGPPWGLTSAAKVSVSLVRRVTATYLW